MSTRQGLNQAPPGCKIIRGEALLLDLDTPEDVAKFHKNLVLVDESHGVEKVRIWKSRTKGVHAYVVLKKWPSDNPYEISALQLMLGSDPVREFCNMKDVREGGSMYQVNVLFKPKGHMERFMGRVHERLKEFEDSLFYQKNRLRLRITGRTN